MVTGLVVFTENNLKGRGFRSWYSQNKDEIKDNNNEDNKDNKSTNKAKDYCYWFIEYDARFLGSWLDLIRKNDVYPHDLLGTHVEPFSHTNWAWEAWRIPGEFWEIEMSKRWKFFAVITRLSHRLCDGLKEIMNKTHGALETYVPSQCVQLFGTSSLTNFDTCFWNPETVRYTPPHCNGKEYELLTAGLCQQKAGDNIESVVGLENVFEFLKKYKGFMLHPVKDISIIPASQLDRQKQEILASLALPNNMAVNECRRQYINYFKDAFVCSLKENKNTQTSRDVQYLTNILCMNDQELLTHRRHRLELRLASLANCVST